jgi:hypothetical protein
LVTKQKSQLDHGRINVGVYQLTSLKASSIYNGGALPMMLKQGRGASFFLSGTIGD